MGRHSSECSIFSCVLQNTTPRFVRLSVGQLVGWSVCHILLFMIFILLPHCSYPNGLVTSNMAPAHPHTPGVAV